MKVAKGKFVEEIGRRGALVERSPPGDRADVSRMNLAWSGSKRGAT